MKSVVCEENTMSAEAKKKFGSFRIQKMSNPYGEWLWSMWNESDSPTGLSKGGYKSAEDAARYVCQLIRYVGGDTENVEIWIEKTVRSKWKCQPEEQK